MRRAGDKLKHLRLGGCSLHRQACSVTSGNTLLFFCSWFFFPAWIWSNCNGSSDSTQTFQVLCSPPFHWGLQPRQAAGSLMLWPFLAFGLWAAEPSGCFLPLCALSSLLRRTKPRGEGGKGTQLTFILMNMRNTSQGPTFSLTLPPATTLYNMQHERWQSIYYYNL